MFRYLSAATSSGPFRGCFRGGRREEKKEEGGETRGGGVVGYIFWRKANDNGRGTQRLDVGTHTSEPYDSISPFPSPHL